MITIPIDTIKEKIMANSGLTNEQISSKIALKMEELSGLISESGAAHIIANELGIKLFDGNGALKIKDIQSGMKNVETAGKVIQKYEIREFNTGSRQGKVGNFLINDGTGSIRITVWNDLTDKMRTFNEGDIIKVKKTYVRENQRGFKELHLNDNSSLIVNPPDVKIDDAKPVEKKKINEISELGQIVELEAHVVDIYSPSFFEVCPECNKRARLREDVFVCESHGQVTPNISHVVNILLDDGSGNIKCALFRQQALQLFPNISEYNGNRTLFEIEKANLLSSRVKISARVVKNAMNQSIELIGNSIKKETAQNIQSTQNQENPEKSVVEEEI